MDDYCIKNVQNENSLKGFGFFFNREALCSANQTDSPFPVMLESEKSGWRRCRLVHMCFLPAFHPIFC